MGRELRIAIVALVGAIVLFFALSSILPRSWEVETRMPVAAPAAAVLAQLTDFGKWQKWSTVASTVRSDTHVVVEGEAGAAGHRLVWRSADHAAALQLTRVGDDGVEYDFLAADGNGAALVPRGHGAITVAAHAGGSEVRWLDRCTVERLTERWFLWFGAQQEAARKFQQASLQGLAVALEGK